MARFSGKKLMSFIKISAIFLIIIIISVLPMSFFGLKIQKAEAANPSSAPDENTWVTNGTVNATASSNGIVYIGGAFTYIGPNIGAGAPIDTTTGQVAATFPEVRGGIVNTVVSDGSGGWYIGGTFTTVGGIASN